MKYEYDTATPYVACYVIARQAEKTAFVLRRKGWMADHWGLLSGKQEKSLPDKKESPVQTAIREAEEEGGIVIRPQDLKPVLTMSRYEKDSDMEWVDFFFKTSKWQGNLYNAEPDAHAELALFADNALPENVIPSVRYALNAIAAGKTYVQYGWNRG